LAQVEAAFGATTLAEVIAEPTESIPLCDFPVKLNRNTPEQVAGNGRIDLDLLADK